MTSVNKDYNFFFKKFDYDNIFAERDQFVFEKIRRTDQVHVRSEIRMTQDLFLL